jgi:predicted ATP-grasp superfamily ATP-dependent carboligase
MASSNDRQERTPPILAIAASARVLAESGRKGKITLLSIDQFGDEDTQRASHAQISIPSLNGGLDPHRILEAIETLDPRREAQVVFGGGLDSLPDLVEAIGYQRTILGNPARLFRVLKEPRSCFELLDALAIPYPEICWEYPKDPASWLLKTGCSEGGKGVRSPAHDQAASGDYYQRRLAGSTYSILFLANGDALRIIGFNTLQTIAVGKTPFLFAGAMNFTNLGADVLRLVGSFALKIVRKTGLVGLNSMDFMFDPHKGPLVLEINPRPSATMALYDRDAPFGLLRAHMEAVRGHLGEVTAPLQFRAFHAVLARRTLAIPQAISWPSWCHDRPCMGSTVMVGSPFCTVEAASSTPERALKLLQRRISLLTSLMTHPAQTPSFSYPV